MVTYFGLLSLHFLKVTEGKQPKNNVSLQPSPRCVVLTTHPHLSAEVMKGQWLVIGRTFTFTYSRAQGRYLTPLLEEIFAKLCRIISYHCSCFADSQIKTSQQTMAASFRIAYSLKTADTLTSQGKVYDRGWPQSLSRMLAVKCNNLVFIHVQG